MLSSGIILACSCTVHVSYTTFRFGTPGSVFGWIPRGRIFFNLWLIKRYLIKCDILREDLSSPLIMNEITSSRFSLQWLDRSPSEMNKSGIKLKWKHHFISTISTWRRYMYNSSVCSDEQILLRYSENTEIHTENRFSKCQGSHVAQSH